MNIKSTIFVSGYFAETISTFLRDAIDQGHEIGCHGWRHGIDEKESFLTGSYESQKKWIFQATENIERFTGIRPVMFRAPNLCINEITLQVLLDAGYRLDSSIPVQRYIFSHNQYNHLKYFNAPLGPYHPLDSNLGRKGGCPIVEVPPSGFMGIPINMCALRTLGYRAVTWAVKRILKRSRTLVFYLHPQEFTPSETRLISSREPIWYRHGLGPGNFLILEKFVAYILEQGYIPSLFLEEFCETGSCHHGK